MMYGYRKRMESKKPTDSSGMDIGELAERLKQEIKRSEGFKSEQGWGKGSSPEPTRLNKETVQTDALAELSMLLNAKGGKGNGGWGECWTCGSPDHQQWNCPKGKRNSEDLKAKENAEKESKAEKEAKEEKEKDALTAETHGTMREIAHIPKEKEEERRSMNLLKETTKQKKKKRR